MATAGPEDPAAQKAPIASARSTRTSRSLGRGDGLTARARDRRARRRRRSHPTLGSRCRRTSGRSRTGPGAPISRGQLCQLLGIDQQRNALAGLGSGWRFWGPPPVPAGLRSPSRAFQGYRRLRFQPTILARRIVPRRSGAGEAAQDQQLAQRSCDRGFDPQDRSAERDRGEAAREEGLDLALDPAALGADRERQRAG